MKKLAPLCLLLGLALVLALGCKRPPTPAAPVDPKISLGVSSFFQPKNKDLLLAAFIPANSEDASPMDLGALNTFLASNVLAGAQRRMPGPEAADKCRESLPKPKPGLRSDALIYWTEVGKCMNVEFLLVPQITYWKERVGGPMGSTSPAGVVMDLYMVDVKNTQMVSHSHFEETQVALSENFGTLGKFMKRGGKFVTALDLAKEGIEAGLLELGLK